MNPVARKFSLFHFLGTFLLFPVLCPLQTALCQQYGWVDLSANLPDTSVFGGLGKVVFRGEDGWITQGWYTLPRVIYYTPDGGQTFVTQPLPDDAGTVGDIAIRSNCEGYVVTYWDEAGNSGKIFHADDARTGNWTLLAEVSGSGFYSVAFPPLPFTTGYLGSTSGEVWKIDGTSVSYDGWCNTLYDVMCLSFPVNADEGWMVGGLSLEHRDATGWVMADQNFSASGLSGVCFIDNQNGWVCGDNQDILHTTDGHNWITQHSGNTFSLRAIQMVDLQKGWAVGNGLIFHTTDGGGLWMDESGQLDLSDIELEGLSVVDAQRAYAAGVRRSTLTPVFLKFMPLTGTAQRRMAALNLFPNPATDEVELTCHYPGRKEAEIEIINSLGNRVESRTVSFENGKAGLIVRHLAPGVYLIRIRNENEYFSLKLIRQGP